MSNKIQVVFIKVISQKWENKQGKIIGQNVPIGKS